jgi:hypothetical protein
MTERKRLIELIHMGIEYARGQMQDEGVDFAYADVADHLLANGVIVPPCKVGDAVYVISKSRVKEAKVDEVHRYSHYKGFGMRIFAVFDCDDDCEGCPFEAWSQSYCCEWDCGNAYGCAELAEDDFGKTVFLSREDAEKALKERSDGK